MVEDLTDGRLVDDLEIRVRPVAEPKAVGDLAVLDTLRNFGDRHTHEIKYRNLNDDGDQPQMTVSTKAPELAMALANGREKPTRLPAKASEAATLFPRISLISGCGVTNM